MRTSKRILQLFSFSLLLCIFSTERADAQFFKKLFGKKEKKEIPRPRPPVMDIPKPVKAKKKAHSFEYPPTVLKQRYRVDVLLQLHLADAVPDWKEVSKNKIPDETMPSLNFYEGLQLAADSLGKLGYKVDIFVHDITDPALAPEKLEKKKILDSSDLIIGAVAANQINPIADYAKRLRVNFVSTLSPSDGDVKNNPYFTILQPNLQRHCEAIRELAFKKYPDEIPFLFYRTSDHVDSLAYAFVTEDENKLYRKINCNSAPAAEDILRFLDSTKTNVIVMPVVDASYAESMLVQLYYWFPNYSFEVFGMPSWKTISSLRKPDVYPNVQINFTAPFFFDGSTVAAQVLAQQYKKKFGSYVPSEMVYRGYETLFWYLTLLNKYGTYFNTKQADKSGAMFTKFDVKQQWSKNDELLYNVNVQSYIYHYQGGSYSIQE